MIVAISFVMDSAVSVLFVKFMNKCRLYSLCSQTLDIICLPRLRLTFQILVYDTSFKVSSRAVVAGDYSHSLLSF